MALYKLYYLLTYLLTMNDLEGFATAYRIELNFNLIQL